MVFVVDVVVLLPGVSSVVVFLLILLLLLWRCALLLIFFSLVCVVVLLLLIWCVCYCSSIRSQDESSSRTRTLLELIGRVQDMQNEVNCMNDSKDFQDAETIRNGNAHVTSQPGVFPTHLLKGC